MQDGRKSSLRLIGNVGIGRHPDPWAGLKQNFFDSIAIPLESAELTRFQIAVHFGKGSPSLDQVFSERLSSPSPLVGGRGGLVVSPQLQRLLLDELLKGEMCLLRRG